MSATVPGSVAHWKMTCGSEPPVKVMEIKAGLRCVGGRDRMRSRRARPRVQAVLEVKVGKRTEGLDSRAARSRGCLGGKSSG